MDILRLLHISADFAQAGTKQKGGKMSSDIRPVHIKLVQVNGKQYFCTVCPASEEVHDDMVWRFPRSNSEGFATAKMYTYDGIGGMVEYITTRQDQFSELHGMF